MRYISTILRNSYSKADKERMVRRPRLEDIPATCFFSARDLIFFEDDSKNYPKEIPNEKKIVDMIVEGKL